MTDTAPMTADEASDLWRAMVDTWNGASKCGDHPDAVPWQIESVESVLCAVFESDDGTRGACIVKLKNGNFGTATEWSDTTGHG